MFFFCTRATLCSSFSLSLACLPPSHRAIPVLFAQEECLMALIQSFGGTHQTFFLFYDRLETILEDDQRIQTCIVSKVLLRVAQFNSFFLLVSMCSCSFQGNRPLKVSSLNFWKSNRITLFFDDFTRKYTLHRKDNSCYSGGIFPHSCRIKFPLPWTFGNSATKTPQTPYLAFLLCRSVVETISNFAGSLIEGI